MQFLRKMESSRQFTLSQQVWTIQGLDQNMPSLKDSGRVEYVAATDEEAVQALLLLSKTEGIIPAIESSHAIAEAVKRAPKLSKDEIIIINVSGRGDKDVAAIADYLEAKKIIDGKITVFSLTESLWLLETSRESCKVGSI